MTAPQTPRDEAVSIALEEIQERIDFHEGQRLAAEAADYPTAYHDRRATILKGAQDALSNSRALVTAASEALAFLEHIEGDGYGGMAAYDCACINLRQALQNTPADPSPADRGADRG